MLEAGTKAPAFELPEYYVHMVRSAAPYGHFFLRAGGEKRKNNVLLKDSLNLF